MKKILPYIIILVVGIIAGVWMCRQHHFRDNAQVVQRDTLVRYDTIKYSRLELTTNSCRLELPKIDNPRMVLIPADSATIIYRDSVRYVTLPRDYFYTKTKDVEIWHSGIDSTIDSLNVFAATKTITQTATRLNGLNIGIEMGLAPNLHIPIYLEYERMLHKNLSFCVRIDYDLPTESIGATAGVKMSFGW